MHILVNNSKSFFLKNTSVHLSSFSYSFEVQFFIRVSIGDIFLNLQVDQKNKSRKFTLKHCIEPYRLTLKPSSGILIIDNSFNPSPKLNS